MNTDQTEAQEPGLDRLMGIKVAEMKAHLEPFAVDHGDGIEGALVMSIALSLKRIADRMDVVSMAAATLNDNSFKTVTGLNSLCGEVSGIVRELKLHDGTLRTLKDGIYSVENALRNNDGRNLNITISKERG